MRLRVLFERRDLIVPEYEYVYKWFDANDLNVVDAPVVVVLVPGYVSFTRWQNRSFRNGLLYRFKLSTEVADLLLRKQPYSAYEKSGVGYYDHKTRIKPGWLNYEMSESDIAETATITIPLKGELIEINQI